MFAVLLLAACFTVPETGRSALNLFPEGQLAAMSLQGFSEMKAKTRISDSRQYNRMVQRVGARIAEVVKDDIPNADWEFVVFEDDKQINAFAMPGGKVGVYTGMFRVADNDNDLAIVMGHEIAHVAAKHGNERVSQQMLIQAVGMGVEVAVKERDEKLKQAVMTAYGMGSTLGVALPFGRKQESEADHIGLMYAARAGYDPRAAIPFWERMGEASKGKSPPEFLSTHPSGISRIRQLRQLMPEAIKAYQQTSPQAPH